ncbi:MAG: hypothetical protein K2X87_18440 [Gemmataceae bacterium]|nr:hypothetical protein [Gemmataceae bacterium]
MSQVRPCVWVLGLIAASLAAGRPAPARAGFTVEATASALVLGEGRTGQEQKTTAFNVGVSAKDEQEYDDGASSFGARGSASARVARDPADHRLSIHLQSDADYKGTPLTAAYAEAAATFTDRIRFIPIVDVGTVVTLLGTTLFGLEGVINKSDDAFAQLVVGSGRTARSSWIAAPSTHHSRPR